MAQPRIAHEDGMLVHNFPLFSEAVASATLIVVGDMVRYETNSNDLLSGLALFDTATDDELFCGFSKGKTQTTMTSGAYGDQIPVVLRGIVEIDLTSAEYNFGEPLGWASKNTLVTGAAAAQDTVAWYWGSDSATITRGLAFFDVTALRTMFDIAS